MKRQNGLMTFVFAGLAMVATAACDNTAAGARKDAEIAAEDAKRASEKAAEATADAARDASDATKRAGEAVAESAADASKDAAAATSAAATTTSVKSALMADKSVDATKIDVDSGRRGQGRHAARQRAKRSAAGLRRTHRAREGRGLHGRQPADDWLTG